MITLNNFTKLDNNQYQMVLSMKKTDSVEELPSETRPMSPEYFAVTVDYGVPADGSIVIKEGGEILAYSAGEWEKAGTAGDIKLKELSVKENGEYLPESGYVGFNKVVVDVKKEMPTKGDLIMLDGKQYRVLKTSDTVAEVLAMYDAGKSIFGKSLTYENSALDKYCNENFYNALSAKLKNAIISKNFKQDEWSHHQGTTGASGNPIYYGTHLNHTMASQNYQVGLVSSNFGVDIIRNCYCISVQDVLDYLNTTAEMDVTTTTLTGINVLKMFTAAIDTVSGLYIALRSAQYKPDSQYLFAFMVSCRNADLNTGMISNTFNVRPAFQIDLSKVDWVKSE